MGSLAPTHHTLAPSLPGSDATFTVRSALADDAAPVLDCVREVFETSEYTLTSRGEFTKTEAEEREFVQALHDHPRQIMLIAEHAGLVVGVLGLTQNTAKRKMRHSVLLGMSVRLPYRGRRVGTALMSEAVAWARAHPDIKLVTLAVYSANAPGRALYDRFGFTPTGVLPGGLIHDDGSLWDQIEMYLRVD